MHHGGWAVEVLAWKKSCNRHLRRWAEQHGLYIPLDDFYNNITYVKDLRRQKPFSRPPRRVVEMSASSKQPSLIRCDENPTLSHRSLKVEAPCEN
jgi:hypothetical protein